MATSHETIPLFQPAVLSRIRPYLMTAGLALAWAAGVVLINHLSGRVPRAKWTESLLPLLWLTLLAWAALLALRNLRETAAAQPAAPYAVRHLGLLWAAPMTAMNVASNVPVLGEAPLAIMCAAVLSHTTLAAPFALWGGVWFQWMMRRFMGRGAP